MTLQHDDLDELTGEIRRLIESNKAFLERINDEEYEDEEGEDPEQVSDPEDFEEL